MKAMFRILYLLLTINHALAQGDEKCADEVCMVQVKSRLKAEQPASLYGRVVEVVSRMQREAGYVGFSLSELDVGLVSEVEAAGGWDVLIDKSVSPRLFYSNSTEKIAYGKRAILPLPQEFLASCPPVAQHVVNKLQILMSNHIDHRALIYPYGSMAEGFWSDAGVSDVDIIIQIPDYALDEWLGVRTADIGFKNGTERFLSAFRDVLFGNGFSPHPKHKRIENQFLLTVQYHDNSSNITIDVGMTLNDPIQMFKNKLLREYANYDDRFIPLYKEIRDWAYDNGLHGNVAPGHFKTFQWINALVFYFQVEGQLPVFQGGLEPVILDKPGGSDCGGGFTNVAFDFSRSAPGPRVDVNFAGFVDFFANRWHWGDSVSSIRIGEMRNISNFPLMPRYEPPKWRRRYSKKGKKDASYGEQRHMMHMEDPFCLPMNMNERFVRGTNYQLNDGFTTAATATGHPKVNYNGPVPDPARVQELYQQLVASIEVGADLPKMGEMQYLRIDQLSEGLQMELNASGGVDWVLNHHQPDPSSEKEILFAVHPDPIISYGHPAAIPPPDEFIDECPEEARNLISTLQTLITNHLHPNAVVFPYGSMTEGLSTGGVSDVDTIIQISKKDINGLIGMDSARLAGEDVTSMILWRVRKILLDNGFGKHPEHKKISPFLLTMKYEQFDVGFTVNNGEQLYRNRLLRLYAKYDARLKSVWQEIKAWAMEEQVHGNVRWGYPKTHTWMNMLIFYFQVHKQLPALQGGMEPVLFVDQDENKKDLGNVAIDSTRTIPADSPRVDMTFQGFLDFYANTFEWGSDVVFTFCFYEVQN